MLEQRTPSNRVCLPLTKYKKPDNSLPSYAQLDKALDILMGYFDCIPEEEQVEVDKKLQALGL